MVESVGFRLPAMNATRWNSQVRMISQFFKAMEIDPDLPNKLNAMKKFNIDSIDMKTLKVLMLLLIPFRQATDEWQKEHETLGSVIPSYCDMVNKLKELVKPRGPIVHCILVAKELLRSLESRLSYVLQDSYYIIGKISKMKVWLLIRKLGFTFLL